MALSDSPKVEKLEKYFLDEYDWIYPGGISRLYWLAGSVSQNGL